MKFHLEYVKLWAVPFGGTRDPQALRIPVLMAVRLKLAIVVPTVREGSISSFLQAWSNEFDQHTVFVVEDNPQKTFTVAAANTSHYCWSDIEKEFGRDSWIIPRRTDCIRSFGFYKAFESGADVILTLDDDCHPPCGEFISKHVENLSRPACSNAWISTGLGIQPRGMPYCKLKRQNDCVISHGLWDENPDLDAVTQLATLRSGAKFEPLEQVIPRGVYFPMCGMNLAFKRNLVPAMYFLLMGEAWPYDRFGDIWCGLVVKKICDHLGFGVRSGEPKVVHKKHSDMWANLQKEVSAYKVNETFWEGLDSIRLTRSDVCGCYREIADKLPFLGEYWDRTRAAMNFWVSLYPSS